MLPMEYLGAVEPDSLRIASVVSSWPVITKLSGDELVISPMGRPSELIQVSITLTASRRGFGLGRFPEFTAAQKARNDAFYAAAHRS